MAIIGNLGTFVEKLWNLTIRVLQIVITVRKWWVGLRLHSTLAHVGNTAIYLPKVDRVLRIFPVTYKYPDVIITYTRWHWNKTLFLTSPVLKPLRWPSG